MWRTYIDSLVADPARTWSWNQHSFEWIQGICSYIGMLQGAFRYGAFSSGGWSWSGIFRTSFIKFLLTANCDFKHFNVVLCIFDFVQVILGIMDNQREPIKISVVGQYTTVNSGYPVSKHPEFTYSWKEFQRKVTLFIKLFRNQGYDLCTPTTQ
jgi:hypothetical protein